MSVHEQKKCPRCSNNFECKPGNITQCQCYGFTFTEQEKEHISTRYSHCLCSNCLVHIQHEMRTTATQTAMRNILQATKK